MSRWFRKRMIAFSFTLLGVLVGARGAAAAEDAAAWLQRLALDQGLCVVVGVSDAAGVIDLASSSKLLLYVQTADRQVASELRRAAVQAGLLGRRVYVEQGALAELHLADNLADGLIVAEAATTADLNRQELLRVVHPGARILIGQETLTKPTPIGADDWSHPYHGPDNNPQSRDLQARAPYLTQFLTDPWYAPMPQVTVSAGGRVFKALGHIALKEREWPWLNTLVAINGYNGVHLWKRPLDPGFMMHRNTLIATPDLVYLADHESCKLLDAETGELRDEIRIPDSVDPDGVWKWLALSDGILYALVGQKESSDKVIRGGRKPAGWPWADLGEGYSGQYGWGFGRTLLALDPTDKRILWTYRSEHPIDSRATCLAAGRIYVYSHQKYLASIEAETGREIWKTADSQVLAAIGAHDRAQTASKGFASSAYAKANEHGIYFAGPQRTQLAAVSAEDGSLMWSYPHGNFQLVLRDDALYAMGRMETSKMFDYRTGRVISDLECYRGNCTRATGTVDSIFTRGYRHTGTMRLDLTGNYPRRIPVMRPACQDGVVVASGMLYWGPWMCDCNHSLIGMISLASAGDFDFSQQATNQQRLEQGKDFDRVASVDTVEDWTSYRGDATRQASAPVRLMGQVTRQWEFQPPAVVEPTAPVTAGDLAYFSGRDGVVRALDAASGEDRWTAHTGGAVFFPPELWQGRLFVGSGDGWVYCFEAASGRELWRFRAAPAERKIYVHGRLLSTWPVASGVLVDDGVVYAAAGITSYDGTHVYALDAVTGEIIWQNNDSGRLVSEQQVTGISVQGHLLLHDGRLYLAGGNVVSPAVYDAADGTCLNQLANEWWDRPPDSPEKFPNRAQSEMFKRSPRGRELFLVDGEVRVFDQLLYSPPDNGPSRYFGGHFLQAASDQTRVRATGDRIVRLADNPGPDGKLAGLWESALYRDPRALAVCRNAVLVAGELASDQPQPSYGVSSLDLATGKLLWTEQLPAAPVSSGMAVDRAGRVIVTLSDGRVVCLQ